MWPPARLRRILGRVGDGLLVVCPALAYVAVLVIAARSGGLGYDFHVFWEAARAVGHGDSPYDPEGLAQMARVAQSDLSVTYPNAAWAVYPPAFYAALIPLGLLPWQIAATIGMTALAVTPGLALRVMGVRDWRCYCVVYASAPVFTSIFLGAISTALMLGFALIWRSRRAVVAGAATIVAKLFLWPVAFVIAAIDGPRRAALLLTSAVGTAVASWAIIGFADIERYPQMLTDLSAAEAHISYSTTGLAYALGLPLVLGTYAGLALGLGVAAMAYRAGSRGRRDAAFTLAFVAALLMSPIVWMHYLTLLFMPLAARFPRFNALWLVPLLLWADWHQAPKGDGLSFVGIWACVAVVVIASLRSDQRPSRAVVQVPVGGHGVG